MLFYYSNNFVLNFKDAENLNFYFNIELRTVQISIHMYNYIKSNFNSKLKKSSKLR